MRDLLLTSLKTDILLSVKDRSGVHRVEFRDHEMELGFDFESR